MKPIKKEDLSQEVFDLYDDYVHSKIGRRDFVITVSTIILHQGTIKPLQNWLGEEPLPF